MKFIIGSDIHGSIYYAEKFMKIADQIQADQILLLGDLYYNGARNDPPKDYAPKKVVSLLNEHAEKIIAVKGNCESEVDQMVSSFPINEQATIFAFGKKIFLTHGHHFSFTSLPNNPGDVFLQGHTHISVLEKKENLILANPGSISIPKDEHHSYMVMDEKGITLYDLLTEKDIKHISWE